MTFKLKDWSTRRVDAINRLSKKRGYPCSDNNPFFDEYIAIQNSKAKTKKANLRKATTAREAFKIFLDF